MPFPRTWIEELIVEWLHLDGYMVEANLPVTVSIAGGRGEADIVSARKSKGILEIRHVETGQLVSGKKSVEHVKKKFEKPIQESLERYFRRILGYDSGRVHYSSIYVPTFWSRPVVEELQGANIEVWPFPEFIKDTVIPTIDQWKTDPPHAPITRGDYIMLPDTFWLLQLLDHLRKRGLLDVSDT